MFLALPIVRVPIEPQPEASPESVAHLFTAAEVFGHGILFSLFLLIVVQGVAMQIFRWFLGTEPPLRRLGVTTGIALTATTLLYLIIHPIERRPFDLGSLIISLLWTYFWWLVYPRVRASLSSTASH
ncbi:MAG: hypothetical protein V1895_03530 [Parcubacteria group bacterium]